MFAPDRAVSNKGVGGESSTLVKSRLLADTELAAADPVDDATDIANDVTPSSLRSDEIHLNDAGYAIVAASFKSANDAMGW